MRFQNPPSAAGRVRYPPIPYRPPYALMPALPRSPIAPLPPPPRLHSAHCSNLRRCIIVDKHRALRDCTRRKKSWLANQTDRRRSAWNAPDASREGRWASMSCVLQSIKRSKSNPIWLHHRPHLRTYLHFVQSSPNPPIPLKYVTFTPGRPYAPSPHTTTSPSVQARNSLPPPRVENALTPPQRPGIPLPSWPRAVP